MTSYLRDHPGGPESLLEVAGQDATSAYEDVGHSEDAREIMHPFLVGVIEGAEDDKPVKPKSTRTIRRGAAETEPKAWNVKLVENGKLTLEAELGLGCFGGAVLIWILWATGLLARFFSGMKHMSSHSHEPSFVSGFLWASAVAGGVGVAAYSRLTKAMDFGGSYSKFPAHMHRANAIVSTNRPAGVLIPQEYQGFPLIRKDKLSADSFRFVFQLPNKTSVLGLPIGQHVAIRGSYDDGEGHHTVSRSYTPVSNNKDLGRLELVIKLYPDGQLTGKYLSKVQIGDKASRNRSLRSLDLNPDVGLFRSSSVVPKAR